MKSSWLKTLGTGLLLSASTVLNPNASISTHQSTHQVKNFNSLEKNLLEIGNDTTFRNSTTLKGLSNEYALWYEIFNHEEDKTIVYNRDDFSVLDVRPTLFEKSQEELNKEILDSIRSRQTWDIKSRLDFDIPFKEFKSQRDIDKDLLEKLHLEYTGESMPAYKSKREIGMRFGKRHVITEAVERMAPYLDTYLKSLNEKDLPASLLTIPVLESSFNPHAVSWAGAVGQFQFMYSAARDFGLPMSRLKINGNRAFDYRKHPVIAFDAFISYMDKLLDDSQDFLFLAPMKYNTGPNRSYYKGINSENDAIDVIKKRGFAPRSYVPEMMAVGTIFQEMVDEREWASFKNEGVVIKTFSDKIMPSQIELKLGLAPDVFFDLNPQYARTDKDLYVLSKGRSYISPKQ